VSRDARSGEELTDRFYMKLALEEAKGAFARSEVPVGAVMVDPAGAILSRASNRTVADRDPTAHAEMLAIRAACRSLKNERLTGVSLYVTVEPCCMCAGALVWSRVARVVYGAADPKGGAVASLDRMTAEGRLNHQVAVTGGILAGECRELMQRFFRQRRGKE
jgi:tRNA(adenine34) deaminase